MGILFVKHDASLKKMYCKSVLIVHLGTIVLTCMMYALILRNRLRFRGLPLTVMSPVTFDVLYPAKIFIKVLFPAPEGPMIAVNSPG